MCSSRGTARPCATSTLSAHGYIPAADVRRPIFHVQFFFVGVTDKHGFLCFSVLHSAGHSTCLNATMSLCGVALHRRRCPSRTASCASIFRRSSPPLSSKACVCSGVGRGLRLILHPPAPAAPPPPTPNPVAASPPPPPSPPPSPPPPARPQSPRQRHRVQRRLLRDQHRLEASPPSPRRITWYQPSGTWILKRRAKPPVSFSSTACGSILSRAR